MIARNVRGRGFGLHSIFHVCGIWKIASVQRSVTYDLVPRRTFSIYMIEGPSLYDTCSITQDSDVLCRLCLIFCFEFSIVDIQDAF